MVERQHSDHTLVGRQSIWWDVAGALVEWELEGERAERLLASIGELGIPAEPAALRFYVTAYAAFRLGLVSVALSQTSDAAEQSRLKRAQAFYERRLAQTLKSEPVDSPVAL